jgi:hypothetical protein
MTIYASMCRKIINHHKKSAFYLAMWRKCEALVRKVETIVEQALYFVGRQKVQSAPNMELREAIAFVFYWAEVFGQCIIGHVVILCLTFEGLYWHFFV